MPRNISIPLYRVDSPLPDARADEPVPFSSAASYAATLESAGIPATIVWVTTVTPDEFLERR